MMSTVAFVRLGDPRLPERFWNKVREVDCGYTTPCWIWIGARSKKGYGNYARPGHRQGCDLAHRKAYEALVGPITEQTLDHLCCVTSCVNPAHCEPVSNRVNTLRGNNQCARNARKTHCIRGHEFTSENTIRRSDGHRTCRTCACRRQPPPEPRPCAWCGEIFVPGHTRPDAQTCSHRCASARRRAARRAQRRAGVERYGGLILTRID
jgi:hypothetical protein